MIFDRRRLRSRFRRPPRKWARFYGAFKNLRGQVRGFEFQVKVSSRVSQRALYKLITHTMHKMKYEKAMPEHERRQTFSSFLDLYDAAWIPIRRIVEYDVKIYYPTPFD